MTVATLGRREQNKREKRGRIIAAARALFTHKGFEATTSAEIAIAAGVAAGTVFTYARTKDELLIMVFHEEFVELSDRGYRAAAQQEGLLDQAMAYFQTIVSHHERDLPLARALMRQLGYVEDESQRAHVEEIMTITFRLLGRMVETAKAKGEIDASVASLPLVRNLFAIFYYHLGSFLSGYFDRARLDRLLRTDMAVLLKGLR